MAKPVDDLFPTTDAERQAMARRVYGRDQVGRVTLRDFDRGVIETMGATITDQRYWLQVPGIDAPPGRPGVLVTFSFPEAEFKSYILPLVLVRRDDIQPANDRWHPYHETYRTVPQTAQRVQFPDDGSENAGRIGYNRREVGYQAIPFDFHYTISIFSHYRGAAGQRGQVQLVLQHVLKTYAPYASVVVQDSLGDPRYYNTFTEGISVLDEHPEVGERILGFALTVRVQGELDLYDPAIFPTVTKPLTVNLRRL